MFMLSDANLAMYGVSPTSLATALMSDPMVILSPPTAPLSPAADAFPQRISLNTSDCCRQVNSYAIFIAGEAAAESLKQEMPVGHARAHARSRFALCAASNRDAPARAAAAQTWCWTRKTCRGSSRISSPIRCSKNEGECCRLSFLQANSHFFMSWGARREWTAGREGELRGLNEIPVPYW